MSVRAPDEPLKSARNRASTVPSAEVALYGVYEISKLLTMPERLEITLAKVLQILSNFLDMRHGLIALLDREGTPEVVVGCGWSEATAMRYFEGLPERAIGCIVTTQMPLVVENMKDEPLFESFDFSAWGPPEGNVSFIGVPIKDRGQVVGTLTIDRDRAEQPSVGFDADVRFLTMIANLVGQTVRLQRLIARDRERLLEEQHRLGKVLERSAAPSGPAAPNGIVGSSTAIRTVLDKVKIIARSNSTVLLRGESGTGKELFARAVHDLSPRKDEPFVSVNCAALPESVLESELFGHEKGAFTGAASQRKGRFELADRGTLFLDEIGDISPAFQAKLLRVLQEGELQRVGGTSTLKVDVRVVAATNCNLEEAVAGGEFRQDLYYRISVVPIFLPPLRERKEDIPSLAQEFLRRYNQEHGTRLELTKDAVSVLTSCCFPGNVRELENCVRRTSTFARGSKIVADDFACRHDECLSAMLWKQATASRYVSPPIARHNSAGRPPGAEPGVLAAPEKTERERLIEAMEAAGWVQAKAARLLGLTPRQIGYALRRHGVPIKKF